MSNRSTRFPTEYPFRESPADHSTHPMIVKNQIVALIFNITKSFPIREPVCDPSIGRLVLLVSIVLIGVGLRFHAIDREPLD